MHISDAPLSQRKEDGGVWGGGHESKIKDKMVWFALQVYYFMAFTYSLPLQFQDFLLPASYQYLGLYKYV